MPITMSSADPVSVIVTGGFISGPVSDVSSPAVQIGVNTVAQQILVANSNRKRFTLQNVGTTVIKILLGIGIPTQTAFHFALPAGGTDNDGSSYIWNDVMWQGAVQAISSGSGGLLLVAELT